MKPIKHLIFAAAVCCAAPLAAGAEILSLNAISTYLNAMQTAKAEFTQINDDGSISTGVVLIKRPGKVRFEYNPPEAGLVVASNDAVYIFDSKSNQPPETYPLSRTPLSIILAKTVDLAQTNMVTGHRFDGTATVVTAQDPRNPEYGSLQLKFTGNPVELRQWVINDGNGGQTTVVLGALEQGVRLANRLFAVETARGASDR